jgi:4-hydroxybutyryl-CoA dehydratase / vinylacetyl-CoA-Delta-isomerase
VALRTADQFVAGLRDGRRVYAAGQRVADVTEHPALRIAAEHAANVYRLAAEPEIKDLFTWERDGERVSRYFEPIRTAEALQTRGRLIEEHTRRGRSTLNLTKAVGTDALNALTVVSAGVDRARGTDYGERVDAYLYRCALEDRSVVLAQTDAKGDRRLRPNEQPDPDAYLRIVERRPDGIVVQGAKAHTTMAPLADEIIVVPTRAMSSGDADYAVAFSLPVDTEGLSLVCGPLPDPSASSWEAPVSRRNVEIESLTVFERVFVPRERVFLAGEHEFAGALATTFATYHRFTAIAYKLPFAQLLLGCAVMIAHANGTLGASHVREKIAALVHYRELLRACVDCAARHAIPAEGGLLLPSPVFTNVGKYHFASRFHDMIRAVQDVAGGFTITAPGKSDLESKQIGPLIRKYLAGAAGIDPELRLRLFHLIRDLTASEFGGYNQIVTLHGEGSLQAQVMQMLRDADLTPAVAAVADVLDEELQAPTPARSELPLLRGERSAG